MRNRLGFGTHRKLTSCLECPSQAGCPIGDLWTRLGASIGNLKPKVKIFKSQDEVELAVLADGYQAGDPQGLPEDSTFEQGDTPICAALHFRKPADDAGPYSVDVSLQMNATSTLRDDLNLLDTTYRWVQDYVFSNFYSSFWLIFGKL